jgi:hypothetical protein
MGQEMTIKEYKKELIKEFTDKRNYAQKKALEETDADSYAAASYRGEAWGYEKVIERLHRP